VFCDWQQQICDQQGSCQKGNFFEVLSKAIAQYWGRTNLGAVKGAPAALDNRVTVLKEVSFFGEIVIKCSRYPDRSAKKV